jgi:hypothetical protein
VSGVASRALPLFALVALAIGCGEDDDAPADTAAASSSSSSSSSSGAGGETGGGGGAGAAGGGGGSAAAGGAGGAPPPSPCVADPNIVFCADFDSVAQPSDGWTGASAEPLVVAELDTTTSTSPPRSLKLTFPGDAVEEPLYLLSADTDLAFGDAALIDLRANIKVDASGSGEVLALELGGDIARVLLAEDVFQLQLVGWDGSQTQVGTVVPGGWSTCSMRLDASGTLIVVVDSGAPVVIPLAGGVAAGASVGVHVGLNGKTAGPQDAVDIAFDDVILRAGQ